MEALYDWVRQQIPAAGEPLPVAGDAGLRRYFRVPVTPRPGGPRSLIAMDAGADRASCLPFVFIDDLLRSNGLRAPRIIASDLDRGYLLLEDLGERTLLDVLTADTADDLYAAATEALVHLQDIPCPPELTCYDEALLRRELALFPDWYLERHLQVPVTAALRAQLDAVFDLLVARALAQPRVLVHRDFMPRNLLPGGEGDRRPGILDFQDAVCGPVSYDPVCLFKDAFISWPEARVVGWLEHYWQRARGDGIPVPERFSTFYADCDFMGAQRHLKVIGIFARLCYRDGKPQYLDDVPRFIDYLRGACERRPELAPLAQVLDSITAVQAAPA